MAIVVWDLDGVHACWDDGVDYLATTQFAHIKGIPLKHERTTFEFFDQHSEEVRDALMEIMRHPDLYKMLEVDPKVKRAFHAIEEAGHINRFASTPWPDNLTCMQDKSDWVAKMYGEEARKHLTLTYDKTLVRGDVLIDDKPEIHGVLEDNPEWVHILPTKPYNLDSPNPYRIDDFESDLPKLLQWLDEIEIHKTIQKLVRGEQWYA